MKKTKVFSGNDLMMLVSDLFDEYCNGKENIVFNFLEIMNDKGYKPFHSYGLRSFVKNCEPYLLEKIWKLNALENTTKEGEYVKSYVFHFEEVKREA